MRRNKSLSRNNLKVNRQNLINKISDAMNMKYSNFFTCANYDTKTLKEDIEKLLSTQYCTKDPREVFKPIESSILEIVKKKNPNLQVKVKKARKLPEIKYSHDKYEEADNIEMEKEKEKEKGNRSRPSLPNKIRPKQKYVSAKKINEKAKVNIKQNIKSAVIKNDLTNIDNNNSNTNTNTNNNNNNTQEVKKDETNNTMYRLKEEYGYKNPSVEKIKDRIKNDSFIQVLTEEQKIYEKEQEEKKQKKIMEQNNYYSFLKSQIEERNKRKEQERQNELKELEEIQQYMNSQKEKENQKKMEEQLKREKLKQNYDQLVQERDDMKKKKKLEDEIQDKLLAEQIKEEIINEKKNIIEKKNKMKEQILKTQEINEKLAQEKLNNKNKEEDMFEEGLIKPESLSTNALKERINKRAKEQEIAGNYLLKIYNSLEKKNQDAYITEREKQDQKKKMEYEMADKNRRLKIDDYKKYLQDTLANKILEKEKKKIEDAKIRQNMEEEYAMYLKEEKEKKLKKFEKYENYRKALAEQIKDNKMREIEKMKIKY